MVMNTTATPNFQRQTSKEIMDAANRDEKNGEDDVQVEFNNGFKSENVSNENGWTSTEEEEDLEATVNAVQDQAEATAQAVQSPNVENQQPSIVEFLSSFLLQAGMTETLNIFQNEWNEMMERGLVDEDCVGLVPEVYTENLLLEWELKIALREAAETREAASLASQRLARIRRARDIQRGQHKRLLQEKTKLIEEMKKLKCQCENYEPIVKRMNAKYQRAVRQVSLAALKCDKVLLAQQNISVRGDEEGKTGETSLGAASEN